MKIRNSKEADRTDLNDVHLSAFGAQHGEEIVALVCDLLDDNSALPILSLVAERNGQLVGHALFTAARLEPPRCETSASILAPVSVHKDYQNQGIGTALIEEGVVRLGQSDVDLVFVLGHPGYYPKFGFQPAGILGLAAPHPIPAVQKDAWMVLALKPGVIGAVRGTVQCSKVLNKPQYWRE